MNLAKKLSSLSLGIYLSSGVHAAMPGLGFTHEDSSVMLAMTDFAGAGGTYLIDLSQQIGATQDDIRAGRAITYALSASAQAFFAGATDLRWAFFAMSGEEGPYLSVTTTASGAYNYFNSDTYDPDLGVVYASADDGPSVGMGISLVNQMYDLKSWIVAANEASIEVAGETEVANGTPADGDTPARVTAMAGLFRDVGTTASLFYQQTTTTQIGPHEFLGRHGPTAVTRLQGSEDRWMTATLLPDFFVVASVPVPASAWFFVSGLAMLSARKWRNIANGQ